MTRRRILLDSELSRRLTVYRDKRVPPPTAHDLAVWDGLDQDAQEMVELVQRIFRGGLWVNGDGHTIDSRPYAYQPYNQPKQQ